jgi:hypothetical protein
MNIAGILLSAFLILSLNFCTHIQIQSNSEPVALANADASCQKVVSDGHWSFLYGMLAISSVDFSTFDFKKDKSYKIKEHTSWIDALISIPLGFLLLTNRNSVELEECDQRIEAQTEKDADQRKQQAIDYFVKYKSSKGSQGLVFETFAGQKYTGAVKEITPEYYKLQIETKNANQSNQTQGLSNTENTKVDILELKSGSKLVGKIKNQTKETVTLVTNGKEKIIKKSLISKIKFNQKYPNQQETKMEELILKREDIKSIIFVSI